MFHTKNYLQCVSVVYQITLTRKIDRKSAKTDLSGFQYKSNLPFLRLRLQQITKYERNWLKNANPVVLMDTFIICMNTNWNEHQKPVLGAEMVLISLSRF